MKDGPLAISGVRTPEDVTVFESAGPGAAPVERSLDALRADVPFVAHPGWRGHLESQSCAA
jgi:hypothetical protein